MIFEVHFPFLPKNVLTFCPILLFRKIGHFSGLTTTGFAEHGCAVGLGFHLQMIPLPAGAIQAHAPLGTGNQIVFRLLQPERVAVFLFANSAGIEQETVGRRGEQGLGIFLD